MCVLWGIFANEREVVLQTLSLLYMYVCVLWGIFDNKWDVLLYTLLLL